MFAVLLHAAHCSWAAALAAPCGPQLQVGSARLCYILCMHCLCGLAIRPATVLPVQASKQAAPSCLWPASLVSLLGMAVHLPAGNVI